MQIAHQAGIVHRDLKPANIMINNEGLLKILDFGVAAAQKEGDTQLTKTGYVIGSPKYMAPEQILGKKVDVRADVYSLGVIMYEMVTGQPPYSRGDHMSVMYQHVQGKAKAPIDVNPRLPKPLSELVSKAMSVDKLKRFQNMDEMRIALEKVRLTGGADRAGGWRLEVVGLLSTPRRKSLLALRPEFPFDLGWALCAHRPQSPVLGPQS